MFWMMNGMGPRGGRRMPHGGYRPMGGLFMVPGILFGGFFGIYVILALLNVAGIVIGSVFSGLAAVFSGLMNGVGEIFSGIGSTGGVIAGIVMGVILYYVIRRQRNARSTEKEDISSL